MAVCANLLYWKMSSNASRDSTNWRPSKVIRMPATRPSIVDPVTRRVSRIITKTIKAPAVAVPKTWSAKDDPQITSRTEADSLWWKTFNDSTLDRLVELAYRLRESRPVPRPSR